MKLKSIRYFLVLCDERNFTRAAKRCGIAQPSLTVAIQRLEDAFGGALFHRSHFGPADPTDLGLRLKPYFEQIMKAARAAQDSAIAYRQENPVRAVRAQSRRGATSARSSGSPATGSRSSM